MFLVVLFAACTSNPRDPSLIGVVAEEERTGSISTRFGLTDGRSVVIDANDFRQLGPGLDAEPGDLLLVGNDQQGGWLAVLRGGGRCYELESFGHDEGDFVVFDVGFRLPKHPEFRGGRDSVYDTPLIAFCVDEQGLVRSYGPPPLGDG